MKDDSTALLADAPSVIGWTTDPTGVLRVVTALPRGTPPLAYAFQGGDGDLHVALPKRATRSAFGDVNLVEATDAPAAWRLAENAKTTRFGVNLSETWTLVGSPTYYLRSQVRDEHQDFRGGVQLVDPLTGDTTPIQPLTAYRLEILAAVHRCSAAVSVVVLDAEGSAVDTVIRQIDPRHRGGGKAADYDAVGLEFVAPPSGASVRVSITKGPTEHREDSFVFFTRVSLRSLEGARDGEALRLPKAGLSLLRSDPRGQVEQALLVPPDELFSGGHVDLTLVISSRDHRVEAGPIRIERVAVAELDKLDVDRAGRVSMSGRVMSGQDRLMLGLFVDGEESMTTTAAVIDGRFDAAAALGADHLDGRPHVIEVRVLPQHAPLGRVFETLPNRLTPFDAIQTHTRAPSDIGASPLAGHHFRAFRIWADSANLGLTPPPNLTELHRTLLQGPRKLSDYPVLSFPEVAAPDVTIVVPAHNKFEVSYHCLCALLFAPNRTTFEVVLVDDGSSDETAQAERYVQGVRIVRHETALGFVDGCNDGAALARGRYIAFLNNDTEVTAGWLDELVRAFEAFGDVGLAGSKLIYGDGRLQEAGGIVWRSGNPWQYGWKRAATDPRCNYLRQVDYVSGAAILIPATLWREVGGFSPEFAPGYFEDTDLAMKVRSAGRRVVYVPTSTVVHFEGASAGVDTSTGMKRFQEVNRPKFKRKWGQALLAHGAEGVAPDREKDRGVAFRVLFLDQRAPQLDTDAGSYAAFQEIRLLQACGAKVTFMPRNLAWLDRHTLALERIGVECLYAPHVMDFVEYVREHAAEFDVIYLNRYRLAELVLPLIRSAAPQTKVVLNLADLHFLRELREAEAGTPGYSFKTARETRAAELAVIRAADLTLSYTDVELAVIQSHIDGEARTGKLPWVVDTPGRTRTAFEETRDLLFVGGFGHPPNLQAVRFFASEVTPLLREGLPEVALEVVGSQPPPDLIRMSGPNLRVVGQLPDLQPAFDRARIFVAPLLAGAGMKGKVLEAMAQGAAMVLSPVAAEGTGLVDGTDCLIADKPQAWAEAVTRLYTDADLWRRLGDAAQHAARSRFSFDAGVRRMQDLLMKIDVFGAPGLVYKHARPDEPLS
jgi:O-antigen biosynthesis protein